MNKNTIADVKEFIRIHKLAEFYIDDTYYHEKTKSHLWFRGILIRKEESFYCFQHKEDNSLEYIPCWCDLRTYAGGFSHVSKAKTTTRTYQAEGFNGQPIQELYEERED